MTNDPFSDARSGFLRTDDLVGRLILVNPKQIIEKKSSYPGQADKMYDTVIGDCLVLDGEPNEDIDSIPFLIEDMHFPGAVITGQLRSKIGKPAEQGGMVLGRVAKQKSQTKGYNDANVLSPPTDDDKVVARPAAAKYIKELAALAVDPFASAD